MLKESLESTTSIFVPEPVLTVVPSLSIAIPERSSAFFNAMAALLPITVYNSDTTYVVQRQTAIVVSGVVRPLATVIVLVNNINQSPTIPVVADANGAWSTTIILNPGQNVISVSAT